jgi:biopolymer transport protein ExbB
MDLLHLLRQGDALTQGVALLLLAMSVASWVVILWKLWFLRRVARQATEAIAAFWQAGSLEQARQQLPALEREPVVALLVEATQPPPAGGLAASGDRAQQLTRSLRDALHRVSDQLQFGHVLLASVGATAPFVGLLGTVWGIYHALAGLTGGGPVTLDQVAGPVGEALVMTAAGLGVALPAVLAYNVFNRRVARLEADLEGFARDLRDLLAGRA